jgi:hypothetical protein
VIDVRGLFRHMKLGRDAARYCPSDTLECIKCPGTESGAVGTKMLMHPSCRSGIFERAVVLNSGRVIVV